MKSLFALAASVAFAQTLTPLSVVAENAQPPAPPAPAAAPQAVAPAAANPPGAAPVKEIPDVVAIVEGSEIKKADLESALKQVLARSERTDADFTPEQKYAAYTSMLNDLILDRLVELKSSKIEVADSQVDAIFMRFEAQVLEAKLDPKDIKNEIRGNLQKRTWMEEQVKGKVEVTEAEAETYFKTHPEEFKMPEQVRASHILLQVPEAATPEETKTKEAAAKAILDRVNKGEDFATVAAAVSEDPSAKQNKGDLDFFAKEQMVPEFSEAAFKLKKDEITGPVRTQFGFHIIKLTDRKEPEQWTFEKAKEQLIPFLTDRRRGEAVQALLKTMRETAKVQIFLQ